MIPRGRWWAAVVLTLAATRAFSAETAIHVVSCRADSGCDASAGSVERAEFAWIWSDDAPPVRVAAADVKMVLARGPAPGLVETLHVKPRGDAPVKLIAAPVAMWGEVPEPLLPRFEVPKNGVVKFPRARGVPWKVRLAGRAAGSWWTPLDGGTASLAHVAAMTRRMRVTNDRGAPLGSAGVTVSIARAGASRSVAAQYRTDSGGWFEIEGLPDQEPLTVIVSDRNHAPAAIADRLPQLPDTIALRRGVQVTARFVDRKDEPVPGVRVRAEAWLGSSGAVVTRETASAADGSWTIDRLPAEARVVIVATRQGLAPIRNELDIETSLDLGCITLEPGIALPVRVIDAADRLPVHGATVRARPGREAKTNAKGVAQLSDLPSTSGFEIAAAADAYLPATVQVSPPFDGFMEIELTRAFVVRGRFEDTAGQAIPRATARVIEGSSFRDVPLDGSTFRISLPPDQHVSIELSSPASRVVRLEVEGRSGETRDVGVIRPDDGVAVRGRVVTAEGSPIVAASVWIPRTSAAGPVVEWATGNVLRARTDADGVFVLRGAGPEPVLLRIDAAGFARTFRSLSFDGEKIDVELGDVVVTRGATVAIIGRTEWTDAIARVTFRPETGEVDALTAPMRNGVATIRDVPEGSAVVTVTRAHSAVCRKDVDVSPGDEPVSVDCSTGAVRVRGTVLVGQRPADGGMLSWSSPSGTRAAGVILNETSRLGAVSQRPFGATSDVVLNVSPNGEFDSDALRPGKWLVRWTSATGGVTEPREIVVAEEADVTVVVRYDDANVTGVVVDERGELVRRASVRQLNGAAATLTADDGTFTIVGLAPGAHRFRAEHGTLRSDTASATIEAGRHADPLRLVLRRAQNDTLTLRVQTKDDVPAAGALVFVETSAGESRIVTTGNDGRVAVSFDDGLPAAVRCSAIHEGTWMFGAWQPSDAVREGVTLTFGEAGSLIVLSAERDSAFGIRAPHAWDLRMLLMRIGSIPVLSPDAPLRITGLPPGDYEVSSGTLTKRTAVRRGETVTVTLRH